MACPNKNTYARLHSIHDHCINDWVHQRELDNQPQPILQHNQRYYQRTKGRSITSRTAELLKERQKDQLHKMNKTMRDIEEISFNGKKQDGSRTKKTVTFGSGSTPFERQKQIQEMLREEEEARRVGNVRKYKYYFLDNLREGHPKYSPYKMADQQGSVARPVLSSKPYLRSQPGIERELGLDYNHPRTVRTQHRARRQSPEPYVPRFNNEFTPIRSALNPSKYSKASSTKNRSDYQSVKRSLTQSSTSSKPSQVTIPSKEELRAILNNHTEQIVQFLIGLIQKQ